MFGKTSTINKKSQSTVNCYCTMGTQKANCLVLDQRAELGPKAWLSFLQKCQQNLIQGRGYSTAFNECTYLCTCICAVGPCSFPNMGEELSLPTFSFVEVIIE